MPKLPIIIEAKGGKKAKKQIKGVGGSIKGLMKSLGPMMMAFVGVQKSMEGLKASVELAGKMDKVAPAFDNLAKASGFSADAFNKFNTALDGTVPKVELMEMANNAMLLGITDNEEQMAKMFDTAQRLAAAVGQDAAYGVDSLVTGLGRQSKLMLDNLGIMVDTAKANEDYALSIGKTSAELTDQERKTAFTNAALAEADRLVNKLGKEQLTTADYLNKAKTSMQDLGITIGNALAPAVDLGAQYFASFVGKLSEGVQIAGQIDWTGTFKNWFGNIQAGGKLMWDVFKIVFDFIPDLAKMAFEKFSTDVWPFLQEKLKAMWEGIKKIAKFFWEPLSIGSKILWENIKKVFALGGAKIQNGFYKVINGMIDAYNWFANSWAGKLGGFEPATRKQFIDTADVAAGFDETISGLEDQMKGTDMWSAATELQEDNIKTTKEFYGALEDAFTDYADNMIVMKENNNEQNQELENQNLENQLEQLENKNAVVEEGMTMDQYQQEQAFKAIDDKAKKMKDAGVSEVALEEWKAKEKAKWRKADLDSQLKTAGALLGSLASLNDAAKGSALVTARMQQAQAIINSIAGATSAIAPPPTGYGPTPMGYAVAATAIATGVANALQIENSMKKMAMGGSFVTNGPEMIMVGDNASGRESVQVTPLDSGDEPTMGGSQPLNINISGSVMSESYTEDVIIPHIKAAISRGEDIGI